jgi:tetratricopeptide (TPR) repeat protein
MTLDWRRSGWLVPRRSLKDTQRARLEAALAVLDAHRKSGTPFLLYLRSFGVRQLYGPENAEGLPMEAHLKQELARVGANLLRVQDQNLGGALDPAFEALSVQIPALPLRNETWLDAVKELILRAEMIVSECLKLSPPVVAELKAIVAAGKVDQTTLILPSQVFVGNEPEIAEFPRVVHQYDMNHAHPANTFSIRDLIDRLGRIAALSDVERKRLVRKNQLSAAVPVTYEGVAEGLLRLARHYAEKKSRGAVVFYGTRAALALRAKNDYVGAVESQLAVAEMCRGAGELELTVVQIDEAEQEISNYRVQLGSAAERLVDAAREARAKVLGELYEGLMNVEHAQELWQLAQSQGAYALERGDQRGLAQGLSWMAVAACLGQRYELALENAQDAIAVAQSCNDVERQAFASVYLGNAHRGLGQLREAAEAFAAAGRLLRKDNLGRIHAVAMLSLAETLEQLSPSAKVIEVFQSAKTMGSAMGFADIEDAATAGIERLQSKS